MGKRPTTRHATAPQTTAQRLDSIVKSARKIMRKDKGLNGDLDRLPLLTWVLFLKFLDDMERIHQDEAALAGIPFHAAIEPPYRWRDWAARRDGITGPDLIRFLAADETIRPDGSKGPGLFAYLRSLRGRDGERDRRDVIATVFAEMTNRMESGYLLRDVVNLVDAIHFDASEEIHTLSRLYEGLLREMRDAAGDSGEFYTPRAVVRFMVAVMDPRLGETVLDPACGTGGFLAEAFEHLSAQVQTTEDRERLQSGSLFGGEAKRLPFLLAQMNLLLHGLEAPDIALGNTLSRQRLTQIGERDRVNVILTNPPFGGEEEVGIQANFPDDRRTSETALLFLQLIMRRLKRNGKGRAAVVMPNGTLFEGGVAARVKADLLREFNLHTIIRLPEGVFAPYTDIPTNVIFFDTTGPTREIGYWQQPMTEGRKKYSKTAPMQFDELADCVAWCGTRGEDVRAWRVPAEGLINIDSEGRVVGVNLDIKNPNEVEATEHKTPEVIVDGIIDNEHTIMALLNEIKVLVADRT
jgi:type I restriction enzyme M protein